MSVSGLTIAFIIMNMLIGVAIPVCLCIYFRRKFRCDFLPFWIGCGVMFLFALVLEQTVHSVVLYSSIGTVIRNNLWLYALYGGLMAGLFEETGRLAAMKLVLKKKQGNDYNALMYGAGHGGFEAFYILFFPMLNNLIYAVMMNSGSTELLMNGLDSANQTVLQAAFDTLASTSPFLFLLSPIERLAAVIAQLSLSVIVWIAAKEEGKIGWYFLAILLHFMLDAATVVLSGYGVSTVLIEIVIWIIAVLYALLARRGWKASKFGENKAVSGQRNKGGADSGGTL